MTDKLEFSSQYGPRFYLFSTAFRLVLEPTQPSLQWAQGLSQGWSIQVMKLSTCLHLVPWLKPTELFFHSSLHLHVMILHWALQQLLYLHLLVPLHSSLCLPSLCFTILFSNKSVT